VDRDVGAVLTQADGRAAADSETPAGHQSDFSFKRHVEILTADSERKSVLPCYRRGARQTSSRAVARQRLASDRDSPLSNMILCRTLIQARDQSASNGD